MRKMEYQTHAKKHKNFNLKLKHGNLEQFAKYNYQKNLYSGNPQVKKKRNTWIFLVVNIVIVAAIFIYQFGFNETKPLSELFAEKPFYRYFFLSFCAIIVLFLLMALGNAILIKVNTGKFRFKTAVGLSIVGKYWDNITPFGTGGQFAQVSYGAKKGLSQETTTSVVVSKYMINMLSFVFIGIVALFIPMDTFTSGIIVKVLAGIGVGINFVITVFIWLVSVNRRMCSVIVFGGIKLLKKIHVVKNYNRAVFKSMRFIKQYQKAFKTLINKPWVVLCEVFIAALETLVFASIAYFVYLAFNPTGGVSPVTIMAMSILCSNATTFIPLPGGSGAAEISFASLFSKLFTADITFWALIIWRSFTFYLVIIIGLIFTLYDYIVTKRKQKKELVTQNQDQQPVNKKQKNVKEKSRT